MIQNSNSSMIEIWKKSRERYEKIMKEMYRQHHMYRLAQEDDSGTFGIQSICTFTDYTQNKHHPCNLIHTFGLVSHMDRQFELEKWHPQDLSCLSLLIFGIQTGKTTLWKHLYLTQLSSSLWTHTSLFVTYPREYSYPSSPFHHSPLYCLSHSPTLCFEKGSHQLIIYDEYQSGTVMNSILLLHQCPIPLWLSLPSLHIMSSQDLTRFQFIFIPTQIQDKELQFLYQHIPTIAPLLSFSEFRLLLLYYTSFGGMLVVRLAPLYVSYDLSFIHSRLFFLVSDRSIFINFFLWFFLSSNNHKNLMLLKKNCN